MFVQKLDHLGFEPGHPSDKRAYKEFVRHITGRQNIRERSKQWRTNNKDPKANQSRHTLEI